MTIKKLLFRYALILATAAVFVGCGGEEKTKPTPREKLIAKLKNKDYSDIGDVADFARNYKDKGLNLDDLTNKELWENQTFKEKYLHDISSAQAIQKLSPKDLEETMAIFAATNEERAKIPAFWLKATQTQLDDWYKYLVSISNQPNAGYTFRYVINSYDTDAEKDKIVNNLINAAAPELTTIDEAGRAEVNTGFDNIVSLIKHKFLTTEDFKRNYSNDSISKKEKRNLLFFALEEYALRMARIQVVLGDHIELTGRDKTATPPTRQNKKSDDQDYVRRGFWWLVENELLRDESKRNEDTGGMPNERPGKGSDARTQSAYDAASRFNAKDVKGMVDALLPKAKVKELAAAMQPIAGAEWPDIANAKFKFVYGVPDKFGKIEVSSVDLVKAIARGVNNEDEAKEALLLQ